MEFAEGSVDKLHDRDLADRAGPVAQDDEIAVGIDALNAHVILVRDEWRQRVQRIELVDASPPHRKVRALGVVCDQPNIGAVYDCMIDVVFHTLRARNQHLRGALWLVERKHADFRGDLGGATKKDELF